MAGLAILAGCGGGGSSTTPTTGTPAVTVSPASLTLSTAVGNTRATPSAVGPNHQEVANVVSGSVPTEDSTRGRPANPSRASGGPILVPVVPTSNSNGLISIAVTPASPSVGVGNTQQFAATGYFRGGSTQNLTAAVAWSSSAPGVATINAAGLASGVSAGSTTITAIYGTFTPFGQATVVTPVTPIPISPPPSPISGSTTLRVTAPKVSLSTTTLALTGLAIGSPSAARTATITNIGNGTLTISNIAVTTGFSQTNNCGSSLAAGGIALSASPLRLQLAARPLAL
jgi:hypothetical protein